MRFLALCGGILGAFISTSGHTAACAVQDFIFDDKIIYTADDVVRLSVLTEAEGYKDERAVDKINSSMLIPGYFKGKFDEDKRHSIVERQYRLLGLDLSTDSRRTVVASHLSDNSVKMYTACLAQFGLTISTPPHAMNSSEFFAEIHYRPGPNSPAAEVFAPNGKPKIFVTNGKIKEDFIPMLPQQVTNDESFRVLVQRDLNQTTEISANIGKTSNSAALPPISSSKIAFQTASKLEKADAYKGKPYDVKEFCYYADAQSGEVLFPETATIIVNEVSPPDDKYNNASVLPDKSNEQQACARVQAKQFDDFTGGHIIATLNVQAARVVPKQPFDKAK